MSLFSTESVSPTKIRKNPRDENKENQAPSNSKNITNSKIEIIVSPSLKATNPVLQEKSRHVIKVLANLNGSLNPNPSDDLDDLIRQHSYLRNCIFYVKLIAISGLRLSDPQAQFSVNEARMQTGSHKKGLHATHPMMDAGLIENIRSLIQTAIQVSGEISGVSKKILTAKVLQKMLANCLNKIIKLSKL